MLDPAIDGDRSYAVDCQPLLNRGLARIATTAKCLEIHQGACSTEGSREDVVNGQVLG
jgi:hypothetical protein